MLLDGLPSTYVHEDWSPFDNTHMSTSICPSRHPRPCIYVHEYFPSYMPTLVHVHVVVLYVIRWTSVGPISNLPVEVGTTDAVDKYRA